MHLAVKAQKKSFNRLKLLPIFGLGPEGFLLPLGLVADIEEQLLGPARWASQVNGFPWSAQSEEKRGIKPAKSRYFKNCSEAAVSIPGRNENIGFRQFKFFFFPTFFLQAGWQGLVQQELMLARGQQCWQLPFSRHSFGAGAFGGTQRCRRICLNERMKHFPAPGMLLGVG